ncbi:MAG: hypothetical protein JOY82_24150 [Streptosporangiaceae bacterium]|nr:hypothetical protein [Streptosporangiaceae bacterium]
MSIQLAVTQNQDGRRPTGPMHRSIVALDLEGSTNRTNPVKAELRRVLYELLYRALDAAGVEEKNLDQLTDRGDGVLVLIRPDDDVPKTVLLGRLIPALAVLLTEHNAAVIQPALAIRLRAVVHAGEVHQDDNGFFGEDLDVAFRLLDSRTVKKALKKTIAPLVLVISEEIFRGIVRHRYTDEGPYEPLVRVRVANRQRRGWIHVPSPLPAGAPEISRPQVLLPPPHPARTVLWR